MEELLQWIEYIEDVCQERMFGEWNQEYLKKYIELKNGSPSHDTIRGVMGRVSPEVLQQIYGKWQELLNRNCLINYRSKDRSLP